MYQNDQLQQHKMTGDWSPQGAKPMTPRADYGIKPKYTGGPTGELPPPRPGGGGRPPGGDGIMPWGNQGGNQAPQQGSMGVDPYQSNLHGWQSQQGPGGGWYNTPIRSAPRPWGDGNGSTDGRGAPAYRQPGPGSPNQPAWSPNQNEFYGQPARPGFAENAFYGPYPGAQGPQTGAQGPQTGAPGTGGGYDMPDRFYGNPDRPGYIGRPGWDGGGQTGGPDMGGGIRNFMMGDDGGRYGGGGFRGDGGGQTGAPGMGGGATSPMDGGNSAFPGPTMNRGGSLRDFNSINSPNNTGIGRPPMSSATGSYGGGSGYPNQSGYGSAGPYGGAYGGGRYGGGGYGGGFGGGSTGVAGAGK